MAVENNPEAGRDGAYRELVENLSEVVYATDENAVVTYISPNVETIGGYRQEEIVGRPFTEFLHPGDEPDGLDLFARILGGSGEPGEYRFRSRTGEIVWVRASARPILFDGRAAGLRGVLLDVTERRQAEAARRLSEEKYRVLVENATDAIFVTQDMRIRFMNPVASRLLGYSLEHIQSTSFSDFIHPDDRERMQDRYRRRLSGETVSDPVRFRVLAADRRILHAELNAVVIEWEGKPGILNFMRDITPQVKMEATLQRAQQLEAVGNLAGGIAHNFNNLLMGIQGNASLALLDEDLPDGQRQRMETIVRLVQNGTRLTTQLLGYARAGKYEVKTIDLNRVVQETAETFGIARREIRVELDLAAGPALIEADQGQIEQVLLNLLVNAADAMPGGGDVRLETERVSGRDLDVASLPPQKADYLRLRVADTGVGMDAATLERIFEPFFTTKEMGRGTGLGMASVYGIVKGHAGFIDVASRTGRGTTVTIFLPAREPAADSPARPDGAAGGGRGVILLVDDERIVLEIGGQMLVHLGYEVLTADGGEAAVRVFSDQKMRVDLVILDMIMPGMGGGPTCDRLREIDPDVRILLTSGYSEDGEAAEILDRGCDGFLQKPYDLKDLSRMLGRILGKPPG